MHRIALLALLLLAGCYADLDWRELRSPDGGFSVWMPARASEEARPLAGREGVVMRQWTASARDTVFAVGYADFPALDDASLRALRDALVVNISGRVQSEKSFSLGDARGIEVVALGERGGTRLALRLRLLARGKRVYEMATLGRPDDLEQSELDTFFGSLKLGQER